MKIIYIYIYIYFFFFKYIFIYFYICLLSDFCTSFTPRVSFAQMYDVLQCNKLKALFYLQLTKMEALVQMEDFSYISGKETGMFCIMWYIFLFSWEKQYISSTCICCILCVITNMLLNGINWNTSGVPNWNKLACESHTVCCIPSTFCMVNLIMLVYI